MQPELLSAFLGKVGYPCSLYNGEPRWVNEVAPAALVEQALSLPDTEQECLSVDMTKLDRLLQVWQCDRIRELRQQAYQAESDGLKFAADYDKTSDEAWRAKVLEIKARYPWPGNYR